MYFFATISLRNELDDDDYHCFFALLPLKQIMIYKILESKNFGLVLVLEMWLEQSVVTANIAWRPLGISFLFEVVA